MHPERFLYPFDENFNDSLIFNSISFKFNLSFRSILR